MQIQGAVALVTGANRGLGDALVRALVEGGARRVYATARSPGAITAIDPRVVPLALDIDDAAAVAAAARRADDVTILVNNAGVLNSLDLSTTTRAQLEADFRTNVFGTLGMIEAFVPVLARASGGASIVNVLSLAALASVPSMAGYAASKAASYSLTQALRPSLRAKGIAVQAVLAGPIDTDMVRGLALPKASPDAVAEAVLDGILRGDEEIYPDPMARELSGLWNGNPKALERALAAF